MALGTLTLVPTYRRVEHFANHPSWLISSLPCLVTLNRRMMGRWSCSKLYGYCQNAGLIYIVKNSVAAFNATFGYVLHCFKHFLKDMYYKYLVMFFCCQTHRGGDFFHRCHAIVTVHARMHSDDCMTPMQSLWLKFYWKFKDFTEINVNEPAIKHSSEVSQISNKSKL